MNAGATVDEVVGTLDADGYAIVEGLLPPGKRPRPAPSSPGSSPPSPRAATRSRASSTRRIYALFAKTRCLDGPATHPVVLGALDRVLGPFQLSAPTGIEIGPGEVAQSLHHDDGVYPLPRPHPEVVANVMWALDDFTEANGATRVVAGQPSVDRRATRREHRDDDRGDAGRVGDGLRREASGTVAGANTTDRPRLGRRDRVRRLVAAAPGDAAAGGAARGGARPARSACRSCSGTTSTRRSWATSTAATLAASSTPASADVSDPAPGVCFGTRSRVGTMPTAVRPRPSARAARPACRAAHPPSTCASARDRSGTRALLVRPAHAGDARADRARPRGRRRACSSSPGSTARAEASCSGACTSCPTTTCVGDGRSATTRGSRTWRRCWPEPARTKPSSAWR